MSRPLQNRVAPDGSLHAVPARGAVMGNRGGRIHDDAREIVRNWAGTRWIACVTEFRGRRRDVWGQGYSELFFLDEITALTAGHRPCFECRREDAERFARLWNEVRRLPGRAKAEEMDAVLHRERLTAQAPVLRMTLAPWQIVKAGRDFYLVAEDGLYRWGFEGYVRDDLPGLTSVVPLTPPSTRAVIAAGYRPGVALAAG